MRKVIAAVVLVTALAVGVFANVSANDHANKVSEYTPPLSSYNINSSTTK